MGEWENIPQGGFVEDIFSSCVGELGTSWIDFIMARSFSDVM